MKIEISHHYFSYVHIQLFYRYLIAPLSAAAGNGNGDPESTSSFKTEVVSIPEAGIETISVSDDEVDSGSPFLLPVAEGW